MNNLLSKYKTFLGRYELLVILVLLLIGFVIRVGLIVKVEEPIDRDALQYYSIAQNIVKNHSFSIDGITPTARRSPGYPLFLAFSMIIVGQNPISLYIIQAIINILTVWFVYLALKAFKINPLLRTLTAVLFIISTSFIYVNVFYAEIVTMFFVSLLLYISVVQSLINKKTLRAVLKGIIIGILILLRPTFLYLPVFTIAATIFYRIWLHNVHIKEHIIITVVALSMLAPWSVRNLIVFHQWIPLVSAGGGELWQANLEIEDRTVWYSVTDIAKYEQQRTESAELQSRLRTEYRRKYDLDTDIELNQFLQKRAKEIILKHPVRYCILCVNRFLIFWFSPPIGSTTLKSIGIVIYWGALLIKYLLTVMAIYGSVLLFRDNPEKFSIMITLILYLTFLHSAVHAIQRYFLPLIPALYFAMACGMEFVFKKFKQNLQT